MRLILTNWLILFVLSSSVAGDTTLSPELAKVLSNKVVKIFAQANTADSVERRTSISEAEINSWFAYGTDQLLPVGIIDLNIVISNQSKLRGQATIDLENAARYYRTGGMLDPWAYVGGRVPVTVAGTFSSIDGAGHFEFKSASISGVEVSKSLIQDIVSYFSRTAESPSGFNFDRSFKLPANIKKIEFASGKAVVVQ
tara:strand:- start:4009 stop:4602 length:594 start_codon:yes stop_codon:yes gene_type:complete